MAKWQLNDVYWKIWRGALRPGQFDAQIMEIQTKATSETVIPWSAFDTGRSLTQNLAIARRIVRLHNEDLNRQKYTSVTVVKGWAR
jgi:hypothetical protein